MISDVYNTLPPEAIASILGLAAMLIVNQLKRLLGEKKYDIVIHALTITTSWLLVWLPTVIEHTAKPLPLLGAYTTAIFTIANLLYAGAKAVRTFSSLYLAKKSTETIEVPSTVTKIPVAAASEYDG